MDVDVGVDVPVEVDDVPVLAVLVIPNVDRVRVDESPWTGFIVTTSTMVCPEPGSIVVIVCAPQKRGMRRGQRRRCIPTMEVSKWAR